MPRFLSADWVSAFNAAVAGLDVTGDAANGSLAASSGTYRVAQVVRDVPGADHDVRLTMTVAEGRLRVDLGDPVPPGTTGTGTGPAGDGTPDGERATDGDGTPTATAAGPDPEVTVLVRYEDAAALSRGELDPAGALGDGRIRVRGDLSVLVAGQALMAIAAGRLGELRATTTY